MTMSTGRKTASIFILLYFVVLFLFQKYFRYHQHLIT